MLFTTLMRFIEKDLSSRDSVSQEYDKNVIRCLKNLFLVLKAWVFDEAFSRDHEDSFQFL